MKRLGIRREHLQPTSIGVKGVGGVSVDIAGIVKDIPIQLGNMQFRFDAVVMQQDLKVDLILGHPWLRNQGAWYMTCEG
jgi:hypothetical protein